MSRVSEWGQDLQQPQNELNQMIYEEHDCKSGPDHGCHVCYLLVQVGYLPDSFDDKAGDENE